MKPILYPSKISNKLAAVFLILIVMMIVGGAVGIYNATQITNVTSGLYRNFFLRQETVSGIEKEILAVRQDVYLYIVTSDPASRTYLERSISTHDEKIKELLTEISKTGGSDSSDMTLYASFETNWNSYRAARDKAIELSIRNKTDKAVTLLRGDGTTRFKATMDILQAIINEEKNHAAVEYQRVGSLSRITTYVSIALTGLAIIISIGLWLAMTRSIVNPIEALEESAKRIANGKLNERVHISSRDEIGALATEFNKMADYLEAYYATLERKVEERTESIRIANEELIKKKREMEAMNEELVKASRMKSQFLANVSHELRTPLNSIMGFSELLLEMSFGKLNEKQNQYVTYIHTSGNHLLNLINNILDLSKIEAGKLELSPEEFSLGDVLSEVLGTTRPIAHKKNITIAIRDTSMSPAVIIDKSKFKQIMLNLLSNAVKFNKPGGSVTIDWNIKDEPAGPIMQKFLYVSVKDTGIGIKGEDIPRIFREFEQLDQSITREYGGTGLGLALTKKLIELHKGKIWLESEYGKGTTFTFTIPQPDRNTRRPALPSTGVNYLPAESTLPNILVASESENLNELIKIYLIESGYGVEMAADGIEVLEKARHTQPFAIIIGIQLPKKDGWDVLKELKSSPDTSSIPVIIVSAANNRELGFSLGAVDYLVKPVNKEKLLFTLGQLSFTTKAKKYPFTILCVDDEPQVLAFLEEILKKEGFGVLKAASGEDGIAVAIEKDPDLIILDLMMPRTSGFDVVEQLKKHPVAKDIPIIIFTAKDMSPSDKTKLDNNIINTIRKAGATKKELLDEIRKLEMAYPARARMIDPLTRVFNHRYFNYLISQEVARGERYGLPFSVLLIDVDRLKEYNTRNGFILGNEVLIDIARVMEDSIRKADCLIRYGGDEFIIVLPNITKEAASVVGEKIRSRIEELQFATSDGNRTGKICVSIGAASFPSDGRSADELLVNVKQASQASFKDGGNRLSFYSRQS